MNEVQPIRDKKKIDEMKQLLRRGCYRDYFLFIMGINSPLRITDMLGLQVSDVKDQTHIVLKEGKTRKQNRFFINDVLRKEIDAYIDGMNPDEYLFAWSSSGKPISRVRAYRILNNAAKKIGLKEIGTHTMRKTYGYWFYKQNKDLEMLRDIFNHSSVQVTRRYIGIDQDEKDQAMKDFSL